MKTLKDIVSLSIRVVLISTILVFSVLGEKTVLLAQTSAKGDVDKLEGFGEESEMEGFGESESESGGFDEIQIDLNKIVSEPAVESFYQFGGYFREEVDYSYAADTPDFSKIKTTLNLSLSLKISDDWSAKINGNSFFDYSYSYRGRDQFSDETLKSYETELEFRDLYVEGGLSDGIRVKVGRQIMAWGQSESIRITDVANPQDSRELGMVDLEDARVPVGSTKFTFLLGRLEVNAVVIHEIRGNKTPGAFSEFDLLKEMRSQATFNISEENVPESIPKNSEFLLRFFRTYNGGDIGIVLADVYDDAFYLDIEHLVVGATPFDFAVTLTPEHKRIKVFGAAGNLVSGSWVFKTDLALKSGIATQMSEEAIQKQLKSVLPTLNTNTRYSEGSKLIKTWTEKDLLQGMIGVEYSGLANLTISFEAVGEKIQAYEESLSSREFNSQFALICRYTALNDTLDAQLFWIHFSDHNGDVYRLNLGYDLKDALNVSAGLIAYQANDSDAVLYGYRKNDRFFTALKYSF